MKGAQELFSLIELVFENTSQFPFVKECACMVAGYRLS